MKSTKVLLKLLNEDRDEIEWTHVCYVDTKLYNKYLSHFKITSGDLNSIFARWVTEQFNYNLAFGKKADLEIFKGLVNDYYSRVFPEIFMKSKTDRQGWMRVFITKKMREDLGVYAD